MIGGELRKLIRSRIESTEDQSYLRLGDYVFACTWLDADPYDPWAIGLVSSLKYDRVSVNGVPKYYRHAVKITQDEGDQLLAFYSDRAFLCN